MPNWRWRRQPQSLAKNISGRHVLDWRLPVFERATARKTVTVQARRRPEISTRAEHSRRRHCVLHTTGYRSISQIFSSLYRLKTLTGDRLAGIPLKMVLRPYRTNHNGQAATQYGISLEFRAEDVESLRRNLIDQAFSFGDSSPVSRDPPRACSKHRRRTA